MFSTRLTTSTITSARLASVRAAATRFGFNQRTTLRLSNALGLVNRFSTIATETPFPALTIKANDLIPRGTFAEAQAQFLQPDPDTVKELDELLHRNNVGVVAHFYMDPELQGVLQAVSWPHVFIADSLAMGDAALNMAKSGVDSITVLGVDFMTENVQATLRHEGYETPVYRLSEKHIGCSLAESAESPNYQAYLAKAARTPNSLHVVYINTSLHTKAHANATVPTITCTSSNVVSTVLQAAAQIPDVTIWFGPDTYMGENLVRTFQHMTETLSDAEIADLHPSHSKATIESLLSRFEYFKQGNCTVHHMFDEQVTRHVEKYHADDYLTAHLEVPGAMFEQSLSSQARGLGKVGSTSDILNFITDKVTDAVDKAPALVEKGEQSEKMSFVLGTEAGMITGIVSHVQDILKTDKTNQVEAEIVFPVSSAALSINESDSALPVVPGVSSGEGCSSAGGCATCPYMKMNSLDSLFDVVELCAPQNQEVSDLKVHEKLAKYALQERTKPTGHGASIEVQSGVVPINHMRVFQRTKELGEDLVTDVVTRHQYTSNPALNQHLGVDHAKV